MINGHCECGRVTFEVAGEIDDFSHCHCSMCRRLHGAAYATFAGIPLNTFRYVAGEDNVSSYASSESHERIFCSVCGSNIFAALDSEPDTLYVAMGVIDGDPPRPPGYHIYVGSKAPWHEITDDLPQYETGPSD